MNPVLLEVRDLTIRFGQRTVVHGISFSIAKGEVLGLVGESGSGKSASSLATMGLLGPAASVEGQILFEGTNLLSLPEAKMRSYRGREIAMIFQEPMTALNPVMRVGEQIAETVRAHHPNLSRAEVKQRSLAAMHDVSIPEPETRFRDYPHQFSGGQRQRLLIAMAIVNKPKLLIADEPTTALDVTVQEQILKVLADLRAKHGLSMLFISHDLAVTAQTADTVAVMQNGSIVEMATTQAIFHNPQHPYTRRLLAAVPTMTTDRSKPLLSLA